MSYQSQIPIVKAELGIDVTPEQLIDNPSNIAIFGDLYSEASSIQSLRKSRTPQGPIGELPSFKIQDLIGRREDIYQQHVKKISDFEALPEDTPVNRATKRIVYEQDFPLYSNEAQKLDSDIERYLGFREKQLVEPIGYNIKSYISLGSYRRAQNEFFGKVSQRASRIRDIKDPIEREATFEQEDIQTGFESGLLDYEGKIVKRKAVEFHESRNMGADIEGGPENPSMTPPISRQDISLGKLIVGDKQATNRFFNMGKQKRQSYRQDNPLALPRETRKSNRNNSIRMDDIFAMPKQPKGSGRNNMMEMMNMFAPPKESRHSGRNGSVYNFNFQKFLNNKTRWF